jgi:uncharacterized SAM-binding protein YcdF (DUF218 family)
MAAAVTLSAGFFIFAANIPADEAVSANTPADGIVVLTGGGQRVREAVRLFSEGKAKRLLISGVNRTTSRGDLQRLAPLPRALAECCVDAGYAAQDTTGNADETRAWAEAWGFRRLIVVTSNYHMPRSMTEFMRVMPDADLVWHPVKSRNFHAEYWWRYPADVRLAVSEYVKFLKSAARLVVARLIGTDEADREPRAAAATSRRDHSHP